MAETQSPTTATGQGSKGGAIENSDTNNVVSIISALRSKALRAAKAAWVAGERGPFRVPPDTLCRLVIGRDDVLPRYRVIACKPRGEGEKPPRGALYFQISPVDDWSDISGSDAVDFFEAINQGQYAGFAFNSLGEALRCQRAIGGRAI